MIVKHLKLMIQINLLNWVYWQIYWTLIQWEVYHISSLSEDKTAISVFVSQLFHKKFISLETELI